MYLIIHLYKCSVLRNIHIIYSVTHLFEALSYTKNFLVTGEILMYFIIHYHIFIYMKHSHYTIGKLTYTIRDLCTQLYPELLGYRRNFYNSLFNYWLIRIFSYTRHTHYAGGKLRYTKHFLVTGETPMYIIIHIHEYSVIWNIYIIQLGNSFTRSTHLYEELLSQVQKFASHWGKSIAEQTVWFKFKVYEIRE